MTLPDPDSLFSLAGGSALLTGATGHLGRHLARALAGAGAHVCLVARGADRLRELADAIEAEGGQASWWACDVTDAEAWTSTVGEIVAARGGALRVLVNNAHIGRGGSLGTSTPADYLQAANLAVVAAATAVQAARPALAAAAARGERPSVVNVSSMYGLVSPDPRVYEREQDRNPPYYGAAKAGLLQLTRYAAVELATEGVRVNALVPGPFPAVTGTPFTDRLAAKVPLGRVGEPAELMSALLYLVAPASSFVTGSTVVVDGGWTSW